MSRTIPETWEELDKCQILLLWLGEPVLHPAWEEKI